MIYDKIVSEAGILERITRDVIAKLGDEQGSFVKLKSNGQLSEWMEKTDILDCSYVDVAEDAGISGAERIRDKYPLTHILVIADTGSSPVRYLKPSIMASSLILRPIKDNEAAAAISELMRNIIDKPGDPDEQLTLETKEGITKIPYSRICYIEARMKKIYYRLENEEYGCYDTLDGVFEKLPDYFARCHRSFIINLKRVSRIMAAQNLILLDNDMSVPLSRSYKGEIKERLNGRQRP